MRPVPASRITVFELRRGTGRAPVGDVSRPSVIACTKTRRHARAAPPSRRARADAADGCARRRRRRARRSGAHADPRRSDPSPPRARVLEELAVADALVDAGEVLVDDPAGAHVHVADFGVAHLAGRQADRLARRDRAALRIPRQQRVVDGRARQRDGVVGRIRADAPAVEDDENEGSGIGQCARLGHRAVRPIRAGLSGARCPRSAPLRAVRAPLRCGAAGCTSRRGRCGSPSRS